jgi:hypothetical protein
MASVKSFWIFSERVMRFNIAEEKETERIYIDSAEDAELAAESRDPGFDRVRVARYR